MNCTLRRTALILTLAAVVALSYQTTARGIADDAGYHVASGEVVIVCPLTIGGHFEARTKDIRGRIASRPTRPGVIDATFTVDLQGLETGIGLRDRHMRENYLEIEKGSEYAVASLEQIRLERLDGRTPLRGMLLLHGQRREITGSVELKQRNGQIAVRAEFPVRVSEFGIPQPSYLGVGVRDEVQVTVSMTVVPAPEQAARTP